MLTFADLRRRETEPTEAEVVTAIRAEMLALASEFAEPGQLSPFGYKDEAAKRLMRRACAEMHKGLRYQIGMTMGTTPDLADLIAAYEAGADELTRQAFRADRDDYIDDAADRLIEVAECMAAYWREHKEEAAA